MSLTVLCLPIASSHVNQLVKEKAQISMLYKETSIHEQASVDSAFETLMDDKYKQLRDFLFASEQEFRRFRQIVINVSLVPSCNIAHVSLAV
jgi:hypothetical protein